MKIAKIRLSWTPTKNVVGLQHNLVIFDVKNGTELVHVNLPVSVDQFEFAVAEYTMLHVSSVIVSDNDTESEEAVLNFEIGDLSQPLPITGLGWKIMEVTEINDVDDNEGEIDEE